MEGKYVSVKDTIRGFKEILEGKHDNIPEQAFLYVGTIEDNIPEQAFLYVGTIEEAVAKGRDLMKGDE